MTASMISSIYEHSRICFNVLTNYIISSWNLTFIDANNEMDKPERKDAGDTITVIEEVTEQSVINNEPTSTTTETSELKTTLGTQYQY